ncbi:periplasmic protein [Nitritalea halalkaliphila LW7]|uniref:Periplasmic protein n=1 Tax=Nitritalea halalkaliphila LW7 TaxID=1189621 RepID=I5C7D2_9BACT|nr:DUF3857 and transglutaminase domain-containing protein [Nitritalea halalkaliphila]EIM77734.1 periplasmic protein [Nitritalea halalkaliphila LW7]
MKSLFTIALFFGLLLQTGRLYAQSDLKFGKISPELLLHDHASDYPDDAALVLHHGTKGTIEYQSNLGFVIKYQVYKVVKILKKDGLTHGDLEIPYYTFQGSHDQVSSIKGNVYQAVNGKVQRTKIGREHVFDEAVSKNFALKKVSPPQVQEGAIVEISYELSSDLLHYVREWYFQDWIPTVWSEFNFEYPEYFQYAQTSQGYLPFTVSEYGEGSGNAMWTEKETVDSRLQRQSNYTTSNVRYTTRKMHLAIADVPAMRAEAFIDNPMSYASRIDLQLLHVQFPNSTRQTISGNWQDVATKLMQDEDFGKHLASSRFTRQLLPSIVDESDSPEEKVQKIYAHVTQKVAWEGSRGLYPGQSLEKVYKEGKGTVPEINLLLVALLQEANLPAYPVVGMSRDRGFLNQSYPVMHKLNYVTALVKLEGKDLVLDASDAAMPYGILPMRAINNAGLVIEPSGARWCELQNAKPNNTVALHELTLGPDGLTQEVQRNTFGYEGTYLRKKYLTEGPDHYREEQQAAAKDWHMHAFSVENPLDKELPFVQKMNLSGEKGLIYAGDQIFCSLFEDAYLTENPFKREERAYPIDFIYPSRRQTVVLLDIPEEYEMEELPGDKILEFRDKGIVYRYRCSMPSPTKIQIMISFQVQQTMHAATDYAALKQFFEDISEKQKEVIVLKKRTHEGL